MYSKARATTVTGYKFTATFSEKKVYCSQVSNGNKNRLDHESFYQSNIERLLHLNPDDCKNELLRLNLSRNKNTDRKIVIFQVFTDSVHQAELERYQGHIKLDKKHPYNGAHGRLTYDIHDKHWIPHIGTNDPSNCKADTKNKGYQEIMFFDWKIQLEKIQLTRGLTDYTMIYQGIRLPCKNDQGYCDATTRTQAIFFDYEGNILWFYTCTKKVSPLYVFEDKRCYKRIPIFYKNKVHFVDTLSRRKYFWATAVPCGSENSHNVVQLNPDEDKYYLLSPYPTLMQPLKHFSPESIRAIARNPNIDLQSIGIYSKSDIQHHIRTQQFQKLLTQMDTIQRQSIDQNLRKLAETAGFADTYTQDYSGYFKDIKDFIYLNGEKYRPQDISPINIFSFVTLMNDILAFLGWPYYILEKLAILYAMFNFIGFLFSLLKGIYNRCAIHTQVNRQASVARILFARFFGIFSSSINNILLDAQIKEYNKKISTRPNTYNEEHNNVDTTPTAPQIPTLPQNHPLSLVPRNFRNLAITNNPNFRPNTAQSPIQHIMTNHSQNDNTYEQIIEQPHTTTFQFQNNHFVAHDEPTTWIPPSLKFPPSQPTNSNPNNPTFLLSHHPIFQLLIYHQARILILTQIFQFFVLSHNLIMLM